MNHGRNGNEGGGGLFLEKKGKNPNLGEKGRKDREIEKHPKHEN